MEREAFLARVGEAARSANLPDHPSVDPGGLVPHLTPVDLVDLFCEQLAAVDGVAHVDEDPTDVVRALAAAYGATDCLGWSPELIPGLDEAATGLRWRVGEVSSDNRRDHQMAYEDVILGVTGAEAGFAESGSIVLGSGPGRPRLASVVPLVHVAVLERTALFRSLAHWSELHAGRASDVANLVFITGPSRTGDIEQVLTLGVHGPRHLHVVLL